MRPPPRCEPSPRCRLRGVAQVSAATIVAELGQVSRFGRPSQLMSYSGTVASEHSSGDRIRRGGITKTGNAHLRRIVIEAAWAYRHRPASRRSVEAPHELPQYHLHVDGRDRGTPAKKSLAVPERQLHKAMVGHAVPRIGGDTKIARNV